MTPGIMKRAHAILKIPKISYLRPNVPYEIDTKLKYLTQTVPMTTTTDGRYLSKNGTQPVN